jgi:fatty acid desaturase
MSNTTENKWSKNQRLQIKALSVPNAFRWAIDVAVDWAVVGMAIFSAYKMHSVFGYFITALVIGNRQHALAVLGHEGAHYAIHANRKINDLLSNFFCFWPLLLTTEGYRRLHFTHHNHTGTGKDPELFHKRSRAPQWDLPLNKKKVFSYAIKDIVGYSAPDLWIILTFSKPENKKFLLPMAGMLLAFVSLSIAFGYWWLPLLWYGSLATTFMLFFRLRLWLEHQGTFDTQRITLNVWEAAIFAPHKIWLHWEHHKFPAIPYGQLEKARKVLNGPEPIALAQLMENLSKTSFMASGSTREEVLS